MFNNLRPLAKISLELRRIANALEYFALAHAQDNNRMFLIGPRKRFQKDESELMHTDWQQIGRNRAEQDEKFLSGGAKLLDSEENDEA